MQVFLTKSWLKVFSAMFVNFGSALVITPLVGINLSFPKNTLDFTVFVFDFFSGIIFLLLANLCERRLENE